MTMGPNEKDDTQEIGHSPIFIVQPLFSQAPVVIDRSVFWVRPMALFRAE
jgi:hypothetical protein